MLVSDLKYKNKYLKYKNKYLNLQSQIGGVRFPRGNGVDIYNTAPIPPATLDDVLPKPPTTFMQTIPDDPLMSILELSNTVFDKKSKQLKDEITQTKLKEKLSKTTLDMFSTGNNIIINDKLNYREIYLLAKLFVKHIKLDSYTYFEKVLKSVGKTIVKDINIYLNIFENIFSLNILKTVLLNPTKTLLLTNNKLIDDTNIRNYLNIDNPLLFNHILLFINPINDDFFDFQLNFIFFCIDIIKRNGNIILDFIPGTFTFEKYINSFKTIILSLEQNIPIIKLKLWGNHISVEQIIALANALEKNTTLKIIELDMIGFGYKNIQGSYDVSKAIADALKKNTTLTEINLNDNYIEDEGVKAIAEMLKDNKTLRILTLGINKFGAEGAKAIASALAVNTALITLDLNQNFTLGNEGIKAIAEALKKNRTLKKFNLRSTGFDNEGAKSLVEALKINTTLKSLYINKEKIESSMFKPYLSRVKIF